MKKQLWVQYRIISFNEITVTILAPYKLYADNWTKNVSDWDVQVQGKCRQNILSKSIIWPGTKQIKIDHHWIVYIFACISIGIRSSWNAVVQCKNNFFLWIKSVFYLWNFFYSIVLRTNIHSWTDTKVKEDEKYIHNLWLKISLLSTIE